MKRMGFLIMILVWAAGAQAADFVCPPANTACLITAIQTANTNGAMTNNIFLEGGAYTLLAVHNTTEGENGLPSITGRMRIHGPEGNGSLIERSTSAPLFRLFHVAASGNLILDWITVSNGSVGPKMSGGGILNRGALTLHRTTIMGSRSGFAGIGGGISSSGTLDINQSEIKNNQCADGTGGGIAATGSITIRDSFIYRNRCVGNGAGLLLHGTAVLLRTTVWENSALSIGAGGAILNRGTLSVDDSWIDSNVGQVGAGIYNAGELHVVQSTISRNRATTGDGHVRRGGGIFNDVTGTVHLRNATIVDNQASAADGGLYNAGTARAQNTILARNMPFDCNSLASNGNNLLGSMNGCSVQLQPGAPAPDIISNPMLQPIVIDFMVAGSGYYPVADGSPALNAGAADSCPARDQLGNKRNGACDIGAVAKVPQP